MFSPYYYWAGRTNPLDHCSLNIALYGSPGARWTMTERRQRHIAVSSEAFQLGPSQLRWNGDTLIIDVCEIAVPLPRRVRGRITIRPEGFPCLAYALDSDRKHLWQPIAPRSRVEVDLESPDLRWSGHGYLDANHGAEPLEKGFHSWTWSRTHLTDRTVVFFDVNSRVGSSHALALACKADKVDIAEQLPVGSLPTTAWGIPRSVRADQHQPVAVSETLENAPFYARSLLRGSLFGEEADIVHESLMLDRMRTAWVRALLPFRMPRRFV